MKRPVTITIAAALVVVLILLAAVWPLIGGDRLLGLGARAGFRSGTLAGNGFQSSAPGQNGQVQNLPKGQNPGNFLPNGTRTRQGFGGSVNQSGLIQLTRILQYALYAAIIILGLISIIGLWSLKRWGVVLAIITAVIVLIATLPGLFRFFAAITLIEGLVKIFLAVAVIVLVVLPGSKPVQTAVA